MSQSLHNTKVVGVGDVPHSRFFFPKIFTKRVSTLLTQPNTYPGHRHILVPHKSIL